MAWYNEHLKEVNETYVEHMSFAWSMSWQCLKCSGVLFLHGLLPFAFVEYGTNKICECYRRVVEKFPRKKS